MTDTIKKGTVLWAIDPLIMGKVAHFTIGKNYRITEVLDDRAYCLVGDDGENLWFTQDGILAFFSLTPPEDPLEKSLQLLDEHLAETPREEIERDLQEIEDKFKAGDEDKGVQTEGKSEDPLSDFTIPEFADAHYIRLYDVIGPKYFCKGSDDQLREWGNSEERIRQIKIDSIKGDLRHHKAGIAFYLMLCEIRG